MPTNTTGQKLLPLSNYLIRDSSITNEIDLITVIAGIDNCVTNDFTAMDISQALSNLGEIIRQQSSVVKKYVSISKENHKINRNAKTVSDLNNKTTDSIIKEMQLYLYKYLPEIAKQRKDLSQFDDFIPVHME